MKVQFGAFDKKVDGWRNTDITPHIWISKVPLLPFVLSKLGLMTAARYEQHKQGIFKQLHYLNLCTPLPFPDCSIDAIFSSHVFEHLFLDEVKKLIRECYRVLRPQGICRVVVPDLEKIVARYDAEDPTVFNIEIYEVGIRSAVKNSHHCAFTAAFLAKLFGEAGFSQCEKMSYRVGKCPDIDKLDK
ncbi:class I SAM-dependent methyltransferase [Lamprocystis purpurea]|uniref:class I SAM-dependent methyltransferase n=1 Tax=Lamprocystis purpurea TaxID=61598 RepID=UPI0009FE0D26|nr:methyltransferase domain-containing protein [Lamprocystis purpurea]